MDYESVITGIYEELKSLWGKGKVVDYIPALSEVNPRRYGIAVETLDGRSCSVGDAGECFSIQSISKVFSLAMVTRRMGDRIWEAVGREPSGNPFNSLVQLEYERGIPRNPFINAGALVVTGRLMSLYEHPKSAILDFVRGLCGNNDIYYDTMIACSEREHAERNLTLCHLMKSFGNIVNDVEAVVDVYCHQCALSMNCRDLSRAFLFLANRGVNPHTREQVLTTSQAKRLGTLMLTCGFYDESGDFAFRAGLPGKSGVGGGLYPRPLGHHRLESGTEPSRQLPDRHGHAGTFHDRHRDLCLLRDVPAGSRTGTSWPKNTVTGKPYISFSPLSRHPRPNCQAAYERDGGRPVPVPCSACNAPGRCVWARLPHGPFPRRIPKRCSVVHSILSYGVSG